MKIGIIIMDLKYANYFKFKENKNQGPNSVKESNSVELHLKIKRHNKHAVC